MSTTYFQRDTAEAVTYVPGASATHQDQLSLSSAASNTETVSVASLASGVVCWTFIGPAGHPNLLDWGTGYTVQLNVTAATSLTFRAVLRRVGSTAATSFGGVSMTSTTGTGLKSFSSASNWANGSGSRSISDRLALEVTADSSDMMSAQAFTLQLNDADAFVTAPWDIAAAASSLPPRLASRTRQYRIGR